MAKIKVIEKRIRGGEPCDTLVHEVGLDQALSRFLSHLRWKDVRLVDSSGDSLAVSSSGMGTVDTTIFRGSESDMKDLLTLATYQFMTCTGWSMHQRDLLKQSRGEERARIALGIMGKFAHPESSVLQVPRPEDVVAAYVLHKETGCYMEEALALAGKPLLVAAHT